MIPPRAWLPTCRAERSRYNERMENERPKRITIEQLAGMMANGFAEMRDQFATLENHIGDLDTRVGNLDGRVVDLSTRVLSVERGLQGLSYKVDQLDQKLDQHRQETKDGFDAMHRVIGGMSHTLTDHEERIKALEGE
jgi:hypothetical protein